MLSKTETLNFDVSFLLSMFHSQKHSGRKTKTLWERFKNTEGAIQKHCGSDLKTLRERDCAPSVFFYLFQYVAKVKHK